MAEEREQPDRERPAQDAVPTPSDAEIFGTPFAHPPAQGDFFASLAEYAFQPDGIDAPHVALPADQRVALPPLAGFNPDPKTAGLAWGLGCLSRVQKVLMVGIIVVAAALLYVLAVRTPPPLPTDQTVSAGSPSPEQTPVQLAGRAPSVSEHLTPRRGRAESPPHNPHVTEL
jgi:hypothetical protein